MTFSKKILSFLKNLNLDTKLPDSIEVMNPYQNPELVDIITCFYQKYYNDTNKRHIILGINPGRFGAGVTGIPFTDTKRLTEECGIPYNGRKTHEPSSVFIYEMINRYGGAEKFYSDFYIGAVCPLGFVKVNEGRPVNYNYYDDADLLNVVYDFILSGIKKQLKFGIITDIAYCLGTSENYKFLVKLNEQQKFFKEIIPLDHPRFIMQYKAKKKEFYLEKYISTLSRIKDSGYNP